MNTEEFKSWLSRLPRRPLVALAARCASRVAPLYKSQNISSIKRAIAYAERYAYADGLASQSDDPVELVWAPAAVAGLDISGGPAAIPISIAAVKAVQLVNMMDQQQVVENTCLCIEMSLEALSLGVAEDVRAVVFSCMQRDLQLLITASHKEHWNQHSRISADFFALRQEFDINRNLGDRTIIDISEALDSRCIEYFRQDYNRLFELSPQQFEELIAELLEGFGFQVELTQLTRDGGRDIIAVAYRPAQAKWKAGRP